MPMSTYSRDDGTDHAEIWSNFLTVASTLVTPQTLETWFAPLRLRSLDRERVVLDCPSRFFLEWVSEHHGDKITYGFHNVLGTEPKVEFVCTNDSHDEMIAQRSHAAAAFSPRPPRKPVYKGERLNPKFLFEQFVVGNNSRMTFAACQAVSENPARAYNPLFIYGGVGLGKTHLMQAIGHVVLANGNAVRVHYSSAESFMNELITAIREGKSQDFRSKYRNVDLLLIDDIQFLAGKESTQEEFFHTFNALYGAEKQIVVTSDCPPKEIPMLEDRLVSRFEWGLITDIQPPDYETRLAILKKKLEHEKVTIPDDVLDFIADSVKNNIRELEGSLVRLLVHASVNKKDISLDIAKEVLKDFVKTKPTQVKITTIQKVVAQHFGVPFDSMRSKTRTARLAFARQVAIFLARDLTRCSLTQIGQRFGGRDHTTVIHACSKIADLIERDVLLKTTVNQLKKDLLS